MTKRSDSESFMDMFAMLGRDLNLPAVDVDAILAHHRKNLEALQKSASATASGASSILARQRELVQETVRDIGEMAQTFNPAGNPREAMTKQADFVKRSFESAVKNVADTAQTMQKSGSDSVEILRQRIRESMEEIQDGLAKKKP